MSLTKCPKCESTNIFFDKETGEYECFSCGNKWGGRPAKEFVEEFTEEEKKLIRDSRERRLGLPRIEEELKEKAEAVVAKEEIPTFTPAFLSRVRTVYETGVTDGFWEWIIEYDRENKGVSVRLRGTKRAHEFFPGEIIEKMKYDEETRVYHVE